MSGGSPVYNYPAQPSYGEGLEKSLRAQAEMLMGTGDFADLAKEIGMGPGETFMQKLMEQYEAPLRKQTAQIDTDVLRQTILGGSQKVVKDPETGKYGIPGGEIVTSEQTGSDAPTQTAGGRYQIIKASPAGAFNRNNFLGGFGDKAAMPQYAIIDTDTGGLLDVEQEAWMTLGSDPKSSTKTAQLNAGANLKLVTERFNELNGKVAAGVAEGTPESEVKLEFEFTNPNTGKPLQEGDVVREGTGMVDLLGDTRGVQQAVGSEDYEGYVRSDDARMEAWKAENARLAGLGEAPRSIEDWGRQHYETYGKAGGDEMPTSYTMQDVGRQAGFDESGKFLGLSALAEDVQAGNLSRQRERDLQDVARLSPLYSQIMEDYKPGTKAAVSDARKVLDAQKATLTGAGAIDAPASVATGMDGITSGGMTSAKASPVADLTADISYTPSAGVSGGAYGGELGTYDPNGIHVLGGPGGFPKPTLRSDLLADAKTALSGGLTPREERQISEAMKAQSTMMGRTFDQSAGIAEAKARTLEDRNRQALNRQYAQQVLGQEAGLQQSDLGRGLQASLANQQATNQARQYGVGAGLQREQAEAQLDQQTALANQAAQQEAARYTAQEGIQAQLANEANRQQAASFDVNALQQQQRMNEQLKQAGTLGYVDAATRLAALEDTTTLDPFAVLGRTGGGSLQAGQGVFGQAGYGLQSGPQYLNPESGLGYISNQATNAANMFNAQTAADATRSAGMFGGLGNLAGGIFQGAGAAGSMGALFCWVAREVYGAHNPAWLDFRHWMFSSAPRWFFKLYLTFGERFANFISNKPRLKARIRMWMDSKIGR